MRPVIELRGIKRIYKMEGKQGEEAVVVRALRGVDFSAGEGEFVSVMGPSGSGKSTLMNILGCLDKPSEGTYTLDNIETSTSSPDIFAYIRNRKIGFVFQSFNLLSRTTALENVELPLFYRRREKNEKRLTAGGRKERAARALREVGLEKRMDHYGSQLSGGQQQRVAIARAMVNDPAFILADEPTGNLDTGMTLEIMGLFQELNSRGKTIVMVTHEPELAIYTKRIITLRDGEIISDKPVTERRSALDDLAAWKKDHALLAGAVS
ncbi:ABC transporter ATP-binding protein [Spirochaetia bacterium]|nr:ABC transporter ATP-binding protein [Spirochaetia bacterium]GHV89828.1 ABC transporter ATP-binding protein [Spirochaetia bacterium]